MKTAAGPTDLVHDAAGSKANGHLTSGRSRAAILGVLWSALNSLSATLITAFVFTITSRLLLPEDFGLVALASTIVGVVAAASMVGFGEALVQRFEIDDRHLDSVFWMTGGLGLGLFALVALSAPLIADWAGSPMLSALLPVIALRLVFESLSTVPLALVNRRMEFRTVAVRTLVANALGGAVSVVMVLSGFGLWALASAQVVSAGAALLVLMVSAKWRPGRQVSRAAIGDLKDYGLATTGHRVLNDIKADQLLLGVLGGPVVLGLFFFARRLQLLLYSLTNGIFAPVSHVLLSSLQRETEKRREAFLMADFGSALIALPLFAGMIAVADNAVLLFGEQWLPAVPAVQAFAFVGLIDSIGLVPVALLNSQNLTGWWFRARVVNEVVTALIVLLLFRYGLDAILVALLIRSLLFYPVYTGKALRLLQMPLRHYARNLAAPLVATLAMTAAVMALPSILPTLLYWKVLLLQVPLGVVVYAAVLWPIGGRRVLRLARARRGV